MRRERHRLVRGVRCPGRVAGFGGDRTMSARFEIVRTDGGWVGRFRAANGRELWRTCETYTSRRGADRAVAILWEEYTAHDVASLDERTPPRKPWPIEAPFYLKDVRGEPFWHDRDFHWRHCYSEDCTQAVPPLGTPIRGRIDVVPFTGAES